MEGLPMLMQLSERGKQVSLTTEFALPGYGW